MAICTVEISQTRRGSFFFRGLGWERREFFGDDLFDALVSLRRELEKMEAQLLCAGARIDVSPSGMSRAMGDGRKVYVTHLGSPARKSDIVDIFDNAELETVGSVEEQDLFHRKWVESLR